MKRLLLLSNSTTHGYGYLEHALNDISSFFGNSVKNIAFVPYAGVTISHDDYTRKVSEVFEQLGYSIRSVHTVEDPVRLIQSCDGIAVGGGNTFMLLKTMQENGVLEAIKEKVNDGIPYIGWSAGSNMACPTIRTTNDMPIAEPESFNALGLIPFQINPHYLDIHPEGFHGETREQRLLEFLEANRSTTVVGLREGTFLKVEGNKMNLGGKLNARIFQYGKKPIEMSASEDFSIFLK